MPTISVIVPVYKVEAYLDKCVQSILQQTYTDYELILVDDGSPDCCGELCDSWAKKDSRIRVIHKENGGLSSARNAGLDWMDANSQSRYVTFIDSDDCVHRQYLEVLVRLLEENKADIAWCHYDFFTEDGQWFDEPAIPEAIEFFSGQGILDTFLEHCRKVSLRSQCMKLYKREIFQGLRMREGYVQEDSMVLPYVLERTGRIARTYLQLYHWRETLGSISRSEFDRRNFDYIELSLLWAEFFEQRGSDQADYFKKEFLQRTLHYYYKICEEKPELMDDFRFHIKRFRKLYPRYIKAKGMCIREKLAYTLFLVSPDCAKKPYMQVYGELYREETW